MKLTIKKQHHSSPILNKKLFLEGKSLQNGLHPQISQDKHQQRYTQMDTENNENCSNRLFSFCLTHNNNKNSSTLTTPNNSNHYYQEKSIAKFAQKDQLNKRPLILEHNTQRRKKLHVSLADIRSNHSESKIQFHKSREIVHLNQIKKVAQEKSRQGKQQFYYSLNQNPHKHSSKDSTNQKNNLQASRELSNKPYIQPKRQYEFISRNKLKIAENPLNNRNNKKALTIDKDYQSILIKNDPPLSSAFLERNNNLQIMQFKNKQTLQSYEFNNSKNSQSLITEKYNINGNISPYTVTSQQLEDNNIQLHNTNDNTPRKLMHYDNTPIKLMHQPYYSPINSPCSPESKYMIALYSPIHQKSVEESSQTPSHQSFHNSYENVQLIRRNIGSFAKTIKTVQNSDSKNSLEFAQEESIVVDRNPQYLQYFQHQQQSKQINQNQMYEEVYQRNHNYHSRGSVEEKEENQTQQNSRTKRRWGSSGDDKKFHMNVKIKQQDFKNHELNYQTIEEDKSEESLEV